MEKMSMSSYLKGLLSPELAVDFVRMADSKSTYDILSVELENATIDYVEKVKDEKVDFREVVSAFYEVLKLVAIGEFYISLVSASIYVEVDELDDLVYLFVGLCERNGIQKECARNFMLDIVKAGIAGKSFKAVIKEYKDKDCKPQQQPQGGLPNMIRG